MTARRFYTYNAAARGDQHTAGGLRWEYVS